MKLPAAIGAIAIFIGIGMLNEEPLNAKIVIAVGSVLVFCFAVCWWEERRAQRFQEWLAENRHAVKDGFGMFDGAHITPDTVLTQYRFCASAIWVTEVAPSAFFIRGHHNTALPTLFFSALSLLAGWWGVPWGLIRTPQVVFRNLRGGTESRVSDLLGMERSMAAAAGTGRAVLEPTQQLENTIDKDHSRF